MISPTKGNKTAIKVKHCGDAVLLFKCLHYSETEQLSEALPHFLQEPTVPNFYSCTAPPLWHLKKICLCAILATISQAGNC